MLAPQITQVMQQAEKHLEERLAGPAMALLDGAAENMWPRLQHLLASCSDEASKVRLYWAGGACWRTPQGRPFIILRCHPSPAEGAGPDCALQCAPIPSAEARSLGTFVLLQDLCCTGMLMLLQEINPAAAVCQPGPCLQGAAEGLAGYGITVAEAKGLNARLRAAGRGKLQSLVSEVSHTALSRMKDR